MFHVIFIDLFERAYLFFLMIVALKIFYIRLDDVGRAYPCATKIISPM